MKKKGLIETTLNEITFPVEMVNTDDFFGIRTNPEYSKTVIGTINGEQFLLNSCSDRYELISNDQIFPPINELLKSNGIDYSVTYKQSNNVRFYADYIFNNPEFTHKIENSDDIVRPKISVQHSYNGLTKYAICFGYFRLICSNGLTIPVEEMNHFNLSIEGKHTESVAESFLKLNKMINFFIETKQVNKEILKKYSSLSERWVPNLNDRLTEVLEKNNITIKGTKENSKSKFNTLDHISSIIKNESDKLYSGKINDWLIYNGINQYINNDDLNVKTPEVRRDMDQKVFDYLIK